MVNAIIFIVLIKTTSKIPGMPIAYWASDNVITDFAQGKLTNDVADAKQGLATGNNNFCGIGLK